VEACPEKRTDEKGTKLVNRDYVPIRTCLVCMRKNPKRELIRLALDPEKGCILPDNRQRMKGRGGYVCRECFPNLRFNKRIQRAFRNKADELNLK
jgi:predicted RNA-binding protein YlxR (DUF448 family)